MLNDGQPVATLQLWARIIQTDPRTLAHRLGPLRRHEHRHMGPGLRMRVIGVTLRHDVADVANAAVLDVSASERLARERRDTLGGTDSSGTSGKRQAGEVEAAGCRHAEELDTTRGMPNKQQPDDDAWIWYQAFVTCPRLRMATVR